MAATNFLKRASFLYATLLLLVSLSSLEGQELVEVPTCLDDEFLTSNGTDIFCTTLPDVGFCDCPDLFPICDNDTTLETFPLPPPGCPQFEPPIRGAFVCVRQPTIIYCSVLCDSRFEFFTTPHNPYSCGEETGFLWMDVTENVVEDELPRCTGVRHRLQTLYDSNFYLPAPCHGLNDNSVNSFLKEFHETVVKFCKDCSLSDTFLRCPRVPASARFPRDLNLRSDYQT